MPQDHYHFDFYLQRVHRRWMLWRTIEWIGLSIAIGCAVAFLLSLILLVRGESALPLVTGCIAISAITGAMIGWLRRPTVLSTASEIDRQFGLADLLATALAIRQSKTIVADSQDANWSDTVLAIADARSIELANQSLLLRRYGSRAWGGIGLATATVLTLGILSGNPIVTHAGNSVSQRDADVAIPSSRVMLNANTQKLQIPVDNQPESPNVSRIDSTQRPTESSTANGDSTHQSNTAIDSAGAGIGQTAETPHQENLPVGQAGVHKENASGQTATGGGDAARSGGGKVNSNATAADHNSNQSRTELVNERFHRFTTWPRSKRKAEFHSRCISRFGS